jgi:autotransporter-associated beta strand protein
MPAAARTPLHVSLPLLLASTSLAALMVGGGAPPAWAACKVTQNGGTAATVSNSAATGNCILIENGASVSGNVTNTSTGILTAHGILSSRTGITINNSTVGGTVNNSGTINAIASGIRVENGGAVTEGVTNSGTITMANSSVFSSSAGILIGADRPTYNITVFTGSISNSGTITAVTYNGIRVDGVEDFVGNIVNSGTISAHGYGIVLGTASPIHVSIATFAGSISNSGTVSGAHAAIIAMDVSTFAGDIANTGTLLASHTSGIAIVAGAVSVFSGNISNGGTIVAGVTGIRVDIVGVYGSTSAGGVTNSGTISVGNEGIATADIGTFIGGITNTGTIAAGNGIIVAAVSIFFGGVTNAGRISVGGAGIFVDGVPNAFSVNAPIAIGTFSGGVTNSGTIFAGGAGIFVGGNPNAFYGGPSGAVAISNFSGGIENSGTISAGGNGIDVGGTGNNANAVTISTFSGGISNAGTISAGSNGILVGGTATAHGSFSFSTFSGGIANSGTIVAAAADGIRVLNVSTVIGGITNTGAITASVGIAVTSSGAVSVFDSGLIDGTSGTAVDLSHTGPGNTFTLGPGYDIIGNVVGSGSDTFQLGGSGSGSFNLSSIGASQQYRGFSTFNVVGGVWTVTGTSTPSWTIAPGGTLLIGSNTTAITLVADDGTFGFAQSGTYTYSGVISGTGIVEQLGPGTTKLTAASLYTGGTTISGGTLALTGTGSIAASSGVTDNATFDISGLTNGGASIVTLSGSGNVALGANALTLTDASGTFAGTIANAGLSGGTGGKLVLTAGTETLTGANSYSGGTMLNGGTLAVGNNSALATGTLAMAAGTTLSFLDANYTIANAITLSGDPNFVLPAGTTQTLSGMISDGTSPGTLAMNGPGELVLSGANNYTGGTVISGGTLQLSGAGTLGAVTGTTTVNTGGTLDLGGTTQTQAAINLAGGTIENGGLDAPLNSTGGTINGLGGTASVAASAGTTIVEGVNGYTGATNINGGTLDVVGSITTSSVNVNAGATATGAGTVPALTVNSGGTLAPGTAGVPGTVMTITGNLTFAPNASYVVSINGTTSTLVNADGNASLAGAVQGNLLPGVYTNKPIIILDPGTVSGTFASFSGSVPGFSGTLSYGPNDVTLSLTAQLGAGTALSANQQTIATAINTYFNNGGTLPQSYFPVFTLSGSGLAKGLTQIDGEDATGAEHGAFGLMNQFLNLLLDPSIDGRGSGAGSGALDFAPDQQASLPPDVALAYADALKTPPPSFNQRWTAWASGFGGSAITNGDPSAASNTITTSTYGSAAGLDYRYSSDTVLGFSLAGGGTNWDLAQDLGTGRSDAFLAGVYGVTHAGPLYLAGALGFANNWFTTNRTAFAGDQLTANFQGQSYSARLEGGYRFALPVIRNAIGITPYVAIQAQDFHTPSYSETDLTGGGFGLSYNAMNGTDARSELGTRFDDLTALGNLPLVLRAKLAWAHDWASNPALNAAFVSLPGTSFTVNGAPIPHDSALTSAGAQFFFTPSWSFLAKFDGEFASGAQTYAGSGTLRYTW